MSLVKRMAEMMAEDEDQMYGRYEDLYDRKAVRWLEALLCDESFPGDAMLWLRDELKDHRMHTSPARLMR